MTHNNFHNPTVPAFASRPASQTWEPLSFSGHPDHVVWVWFKPPTAPQGFVVTIPDDAYQRDPLAYSQLTVRQLLGAAGLDPRGIAMWYLYGVPYDAMQGTSPYLDQPIPAPVPGLDRTIMVCITPPQPEVVPAATPALSPAQPAAVIQPAEHSENAVEEERSTGNLLERIDTDWNTALQTEKECSRLRKKLLDLLGRLKAINRELTPQERVHSDTQDKKDWLEARRWLREAEMRVTMCLKEHDIGYTSNAGQRRWFEETFNKYVAAGLPFEGIVQAQRDFETYRKQVYKLQNNMNGAYQHAVHNGERRAQAILNRIAAKIREANIKRNMLGVICDR